LLSRDEAQRTYAVELLADHFGGLWSFAGCFDELEQVLQQPTKKMAIPLCGAPLRKPFPQMANVIVPKRWGA
jgi:hypothetical protein